MRKVTTILICTIMHGAAVAATCDAGYYPENSECKICPRHYACPDGDKIIECQNHIHAQYTDGPGATECKTCPGTESIFHNDEYFSHFWYNPPSSQTVGCRAEWRNRPTQHGKISFSCYYHDGWYDRGTSVHKCMVDIMSCDAGYASMYNVNPQGNWRYWFDTFEEAIQEICRPVGIGYYSADGDIEATACPIGTSTRTEIATSVDECLPLCAGGATRFRAGTHTFNLWQDKYTSPTLKVELPSGDVCHVNLAPGLAHSTINVNYNGQVYHVTN